MGYPMKSTLSILLVSVAFFSACQRKSGKTEGSTKAVATSDGPKCKKKCKVKVESAAVRGSDGFFFIKAMVRKGTTLQLTSQVRADHGRSPEEMESVPNLVNTYPVKLFAYVSAKNVQCNHISTCKSKTSDVLAPYGMISDDAPSKFAGATGTTLRGAPRSTSGDLGVVINERTAEVREVADGWLELSMEGLIKASACEWVN